MPVPVWNGIERFGVPYPLPAPAAAFAVHRHVAWADVVHMHDCLYALNVAAFIASRRYHCPVLLTQHVAKIPYSNPILRGVQSASYASLGRAVLSRAEQVVFVSEKVMRWFETRIHFRSPTIVIENGIDADVFQPISEGDRDAIRARLGANGSRPLLLFVGRFVEKKGVRLLRPLIEATPMCDWLLIGRAGDEDPSRWQSSNMKLLAPMKPAELRGYYAAADLLVLPSSGEGFPLVVQESMACGTPALISEKTVAGLPAVRGFAFTTRLTSNDLESSVKDAAEVAVSDPGLRARVASFARERWRADTMVSRYEQQLEGLLR